MNHLLSALCSLSLAAVASAQSFTLLLRHGAGDLVLNEPLLEALAAEPATRSKIQDLLGDRLQKFGRIDLAMPAAHLPGTFQIHGGLDLDYSGPHDEVLQQKLVDAVVDHLVQRLTHLLYEEPGQDLREQSAALQRRMVELSKVMAMQRAADRMQQSEAATARDALDQATTRLLEARICVNTNRREREQLEILRKELQERAAQLNDQVTNAAAQRRDLVAQAEDLRGRLTNGRTITKEDQQRLQDVLQREEHLKASQALLDGQLADVRASLEPVLKRLPDAIVSEVRAASEVDSAEALQAELAKRLDAARRAQTESFAEDAELERASIDLDVCRQMLVEVQGKLARLRPLHTELIRN